MYNLALWSPHHITEIFFTALLCLNVSIMTLNCTVLIFTALCQHGNVRLANGPTSYSGRVEICFSETWGTVCNNMWGASDASVVCRQLGFSRHSEFGSSPNRHLHSVFKIPQLQTRRHNLVQHLVKAVAPSL